MSLTVTPQPQSNFGDGSLVGFAVPYNGHLAQQQQQSWGMPPPPLPPPPQRTRGQPHGQPQYEAPAYNSPVMPEHYAYAQQSPPAQYHVHHDHFYGAPNAQPQQSWGGAHGMYAPVLMAAPLEPPPGAQFLVPMNPGLGAPPPSLGAGPSFEAPPPPSLGAGPSFEASPTSPPLLLPPPPTPPLQEQEQQSEQQQLMQQHQSQQEQQQEQQQRHSFDPISMSFDPSALSDLDPNRIRHVLVRIHGPVDTFLQELDERNKKRKTPMEPLGETQAEPQYDPEDEGQGEAQAEPENDIWSKYNNHLNDSPRAMLNAKFKAKLKDNAKLRAELKGKMKAADVIRGKSKGKGKIKGQSTAKDKINNKSDDVSKAKGKDKGEGKGEGKGEDKAKGKDKVDDKAKDKVDDKAKDKVDDKAKDNSKDKVDDTHESEKPEELEGESEGESDEESEEEPEKEKEPEEVIESPIRIMDSVSIAEGDTPSHGWTTDYCGLTDDRKLYGKGIGWETQVAEAEAPIQHPPAQTAIFVCQKCRLRWKGMSLENRKILREDNAEERKLHRVPPPVKKGDPAYTRPAFREMHWYLDHDSGKMPCVRGFCEVCVPQNPHEDMMFDDGNDGWCCPPGLAKNFMKQVFRCIMDNCPFITASLPEMRQHLLSSQKWPHKALLMGLVERVQKGRFLSELDREISSRLMHIFNDRDAAGKCMVTSVSTKLEPHKISNPADKAEHAQWLDHIDPAESKVFHESFAWDPTQSCWYQAHWTMGRDELCEPCVKPLEWQKLAASWDPNWGQYFLWPLKPPPKKRRRR
ncbi:hypothetical protein ACHAQH_006668 [Verticillium albo-atrum]